MIDARWQSKFDALSEAYRLSYGKDLPHAGVILGLCPAQLETKCGDAWPGPDGLVGTEDDERNWGACTLRGLNAAERAVLNAAGIFPTINAGHNNRAAEAMQALRDAGLTLPGPGFIVGKDGKSTDIAISGGTIHCDSHTEVDPATGKKVTIPHFVYFANFPDHVQGARYYLRLLGAGARKVLEQGGSSYALAAAMYAQFYYGGFHPRGMYKTPGPDKILGTADDETHDGNAENIGAYQKLIDYWRPKIQAALTGGTSVKSLLLTKSDGLSTALKALMPECDLVPLSAQRKFSAWVGIYQFNGGKGRLDKFGTILKVDGDPGPKTRGAIVRDLKEKGIAATE